MKEHERRYKSSIGGQSEDKTEAPVRGINSSQNSHKPNKKQRATHGAVYRQQKSEGKPNGKMTYDEYLAQVKDVDKIIDVDEDSRVEKFLDFSETYFDWVRAKKAKYMPLAKNGLERAYKRIRREQPITKTRLRGVASWADGRLTPVKSRFGVQNVYFGLITSTVVLVLVGGFIFVRSDPQDADDGQGVAVEGSSFGEVQGVETPVDPTFNVLTPADNSSQTPVFFDSAQEVASFQDKYEEHTFTLSQQPLTDNQIADPESELENIALTLFADVSFETRYGETYVSNTAPDGTSSQVVLFMTDELLVFIRTSGTSLSIVEWTNYINEINS